MGKLVPTVRTTCSDVELCQAFILAWQQLFNSTPSKASLGVIIAQHDLETGSGNECWNWNLGNIKYVQQPNDGSVEYCALAGVWEIINGVKVMIPPTNPGAWFRSFPTLNDGVIFYLQFISGKRYHSAWTAIVAGNPAQFSHLLKLAGYYTADENQYTSAVNAYFNKFMKTTAYEQAIEALTVIVKPVPESEPIVDPVSIPPTPVVPAPPVVPETVVAESPSIWKEILTFFLHLFSKK